MKPSALVATETMILRLPGIAVQCAVKS
jgi:hypothetical protein